MTEDIGRLLQGLRLMFVSSNERDRNGEAANVVDGLFAIAWSIRRLAEAVEKQSGNADRGDRR